MPKVSLIGSLLIDTGDGNTGTITVTDVTHSKYGNFRATIAFTGGERQFGTRRWSIVDAVNQLVEAKLPMMSTAEKTRLNQMIHDRQGNHASVADLHSDIDVSRSRVGVFHQIDGGPGVCSHMSATFHSSQEEWKRVAATTGAIYHCWTRAELDTIIQTYFPDIFPRMLEYPQSQREHIEWICVLWLCGGMYIGKDVMPNRDVYYQVPFAVSRIAKTTRMRMETKKKYIAKGSMP